MKKLFALLTAVLLVLTVTACQTDGEEKLELTNPGEYLTDYIDTLSIGDREIPLNITFEEARELFGDDFKTLYPDILEEIEPHQTIIDLYLSYANIIDNGSYWGTLNFGSEKESGEDAVLIGFMPSLPVGGDSMNISWFEDGEDFYDAFPYEFGKITSSIAGFTTGISTRSQIHELFGEGIEDDMEEDDLHIGSYIFEDYSVLFRYDENGTMIHFFVTLHE